MLEKLQLLKIEVEQEIERVKEQLKVSKTDIKKLENGRKVAVDIGVDVNQIDKRISSTNHLIINLNNRVSILKKVKYRLEIAEKMLHEIE
jgi:flagellin-like hook-associated protein FlgL